VFLIKTLRILHSVCYKKRYKKIKNYFRVQAEEPLQGLLCQDYSRQKYFFAQQK
jgi:hypothetical protein